MMLLNLALISSECSNTESSDSNFREDEQGKLESELSVLEHSEEIKAKLSNIIQQLGQSEFSVNQTLSNIKSELQSLASFSKEYELLHQRIESVRIELNDILSEAENANEKTEFDSSRAEQVNERLRLIYQLQQKHRLSSISDLLKLQESLQEKANKTNNLDELLSSTEKTLKQTESELRNQAEALSKSRKKVITP